jgi:hypothetical protein
MRATLFRGKPLLKCFDTELRVYSETIIKALPNDGAVLEQSAKAFPGCPTAFKHKMLNSNHLQMRNDSKTSQMLEMLFLADDIDIPVLFKVDHK